LEAGGKKMIGEIDGGGSSHLSQNSVIAHFRLANAAKIDTITVYWTGGNKQTITKVKANQLITITKIPRHKSYCYTYVLIGLGLAGLFLSL